MLAYRLVLLLASPFLALGLVLRLIRGRDSASDLRERLGAGSGVPGSIWLHGASVGEVNAARLLVEQLLASDADLSIVVTTNSVTGRARVTSWGLPGCTARLAPLDFRWVLRRFRTAWQPKLVISLENELWPNRMATETAPIIAVGARLSDRSAGRWARMPRLARAMFSKLAYVFPQDDRSAHHIRQLGVAENQIGPVGSLKSSVVLDPPSPSDLAPLRGAFARGTTVLAASTHEGEEEIVLQAFLNARANRPSWKLILAPRHPERGARLAAWLKASDVAFAQRSAGTAPGASHAVYLADTIGEMALWYSLAGITFVGGSLVNKGGHTPYEPMAFGSAILHGPSIRNFRAPYAALEDEGGARRVSGVETLAAALADLGDPAAQQAMADRARTALSATDEGRALLDQILREVRKNLA